MSAVLSADGASGEEPGVESGDRRAAAGQMSGRTFGVQERLPNPSSDYALQRNRMITRLALVCLPITR